LYGKIRNLFIRRNIQHPISKKLLVDSSPSSFISNNVNRVNPYNITQSKAEREYLSLSNPRCERMKENLDFNDFKLGELKNKKYNKEVNPLLVFKASVIINRNFVMKMKKKLNILKLLNSIVLIFPIIM